MKSPLRKLRGFAHHSRSDSKDKKDRRNRTPARLDELIQAFQDMQDMRSCYDSLLSAAAATANSAYEFSEALDEMGTCLMEKTALNEDENSGRALLMLGKVQFELQKLVDTYRSHIVQTITKPSESLVKELQIVEDMKRQCDAKRESYKDMLAAHREKGKSKHSKGESVSSQQLQEAQDDYEEEANQFVFRLKSLKQGQSRSLLTQAARHHAAQLNFFRKGLKSLEAVEPHVKTVADQEHIDYQFSGLEDEDTEDDYDDYYSYDGNDDGELSFDYGQNDESQDEVSPSRSSVESDQIDQSVTRGPTEPVKVNIDRSHAELQDFSKRNSAESQSAPIFPDKKFDPSEKIKELRPSVSRKFNTYVLPTPVDVKKTVSTGSVNTPVQMERKVVAPTQLWHSSPLDPHKFTKKSGDDEFSSPTRLPKANPSILNESNTNNSPMRMPPPASEELPFPHFNFYTLSDTRKIRRQAFSGPLTSRHWSDLPKFTTNVIMSSVEHLPAVSMTPGRVRITRPSLSPKKSPNISPPPMKSPKISELHELPRPPMNSVRPTRPTSLIGHSAPLVYRGQEMNKMNRAPPVISQAASPLPKPPATVQRSFSIPSRRTPISPVAKFLEDPNNADLGDYVASPPLTPISLMNSHPASQISDSVPITTNAKGFL